MRRLMVLFLAAGLLVGGTMVIETGVASAKKCKCKRGKRGPRGFRGPQGPVGPQGPAGQNGSSGGGGGGGVGNGNLSSFSALVPSNQTESVTIGQFTLRENAGSGATCTSPTLANNSAFSGSIALGPAGTFTTPAPAGGAQTAVGSPGTANNLFSASLVNGQSEVQGNVGTFAVSGLNGCVTTGFMTGV